MNLIEQIIWTNKNVRRASQVADQMREELRYDRQAGIISEADYARRVAEIIRAFNAHVPCFTR